MSEKTKKTAYCLKLTLSRFAGIGLLPSRLFFICSMLVHGLGHALALSLLTCEKRYLRPRYILEGIPAKTLWRSLWHSQGFRPAIPASPVINHDVSGRGACMLVALAGPLANLASLTPAWCLDINHVESTPIVLIVATLLWCIASLLCACSTNDIKSAIKWQNPSLACGPAFVIKSRREAGRSVSQRLLDLAEILAREASTRGGQSTGVALMLEKNNRPSLVFDKGVKGKREDIVDVFKQKTAALIKKSTKENYTTPANFEALLLHLRYATGGSTNWDNTQPHWYEFYPQMRVHRQGDKGLESEVREVFNLIAHNGDMDGVYLHFTINNTSTRSYFTQTEARNVLTQFMPVSSSRGTSDSRSVAEWVDFMLCAGQVYKALRYAYFTVALDFNQDIVRGNYDLEKISEWSNAIDAWLEANKGAVWNAHGPLFTRPNLVVNEHKESLIGAFQQFFLELTRDEIKPNRINPFFLAFEFALFNQDLHWLMWHASSDLVGEFALMISSTLERRLGVFSKTQAFSLGYNRNSGEIFGSAEPVGVSIALQQGPVTDDTCQVYLEDGQYALVAFDFSEHENPITIYPKASPDNTHPENPINPEWFAVNENPRIPRISLTQPPLDPIEQDIRETPFLLEEIIHSFKSDGCNAPTMEHFCRQLRETLLRQRPGAVAYDLVLFGVDFNQDLLQEFAESLKQIISGIDIWIENSGEVLKAVKRQQRQGHGPFDDFTLFLGVSNSAQTQSTLAATRAVAQLGNKSRCFVITQQLFNSMSQAIGQQYQSNQPLLPNTFQNLSSLQPDGSHCRRRSEAATLVIAATHAVLTEILIGLATFYLENGMQSVRSGYSRAFPRKATLNPDLERADIDAFRVFQQRILSQEITSRTGSSLKGARHPSSDFSQLHLEAEARAANQIEYLRAYAIYVSYVACATLFGIPLFAMLLKPLDFLAVTPALASVLDAAFFLFGLWAILLIIRKIQGRQLWERMGSRAEVYIDRRSIARIVERYNATLFSNMPAFLTPYFYWADTVQDALHRFGMRAHRGVVTIHRIPDERLGIEEANAAAEEQMVLAQLGGIRFNGGQPQSRYRVRKGSSYEKRQGSANGVTHNQIVLSDALSDLREAYQFNLSACAMSLINRRLLDLSDGLISEFVVGHARFTLLNAAFWKLIDWMPGAELIHEILIREGIDLQHISGAAITANQAQVQSTKHPVSPGDSHTKTLEPRPSRFTELPTLEQLKWG